MSLTITVTLPKKPASNIALWSGHDVIFDYQQKLIELSEIPPSNVETGGVISEKKITPKAKKTTPLPDANPKDSSISVPVSASRFRAQSRRAALSETGQATVALGGDLADAFSMRVIAPDGTLLLQKAFSRSVDFGNATSININDSRLADVPIAQMPLPAIQPIDLSTITPAEPASRRIRGKVVDRAGVRIIKNQQLIFQELFPLDPTRATVVLAVTHTDNQGNFSVDVPNRRMEQAEAFVSLAPAQSLAVSLADDGKVAEFVYLVLTNLPALSADEDDCSCHDSTPFLPSAEELVSDQYAQDIGGSCTNFTKPNRVLEEFDYYSIIRSTDPAIKSLTNNVENAGARNLLEGIFNPYENRAAQRATGRTLGGILIASPVSAAENITTFNPGALFGHSRTPGGRAEISETNPIDWDATPTTYQATTIAHGHILHLKQRFKAAGYSLGDLLYSLPLAPGQKKQIVLYDWDRKDTGSRTEDLSLDEKLNTSLSRDRDINEIVSGSVHEVVEGESKVKSRGVGLQAGGSFGAAIPTVGNVGYSGGGAFQSGFSSSESFQESARETALNSFQRVKDKMFQNASAVRNQRTSVVQSFDQNEHYGLTTEVVANHNHCHAVTMQYFEVLRHFAIELDLVDVQECLFVPLQLDFFDLKKIIRWKDLLRQNLLIPRINYYRNPLYKAFEVIDKYLANPSYEPDLAISDRPLREMRADLAIGFTFVIPPKKEIPITDPLTGKPVNTWVVDTDAWEPYLVLLTGSDYSPDWLTETFAKLRPDAQSRLFYATLVPIMVEKYLETIQWRFIHQNDSEITINAVRKVKRGINLFQRQGGILKMGGQLENANYSVTVTFQTSDMQAYTRRNVQGFLFELFDKSGSGVAVLPNGCEAVVRRANVSYETLGYQGFVCSLNRLQESINGESATLFTPCTALELKDPAKEEWDACVKLVTHLNEHVEYYHKVLWANMDPDRRFMMLDGFTINYQKHRLVNGTPVTTDHTRSLASVVENRIVGIIGNSLVMPVSRGLQIDPNFVSPDGQSINLLEHYRPTTPVPPFRLSVPTKGVFAEAVMGACNSCEKIDNTRFWKWEEHPIDEPTAINALTPPTPQAQAPNLTAKDFTTPVIAIQNAPQAPDYKGVSDAAALLNNGNLFRDATGLSGNQQNAANAMQQAGANANNAATQANTAMKQAADYALASQKQLMEAAALVAGLPISPDMMQKALGSIASNLSNPTTAPRNTGANSATGQLTDNLAQLPKVFEAIKSNPAAVQAIVKALTGGEVAFEEIIGQLLGDFAEEQSGLDSSNSASS